ncbi:choice-of-anchor W domain-containing protein [Falsiroseomonas oryzae]|uniref:choice-of-anchor W domain-containing protein n=1 Tax=Falsiroseomonas oryzae TaxID=2766473 RepID=UPI0022EA4A34|nr:choice-of-anchor W domain-containing protein [Roseomonas sp. MO-31]
METRRSTPIVPLRLAAAAALLGLAMPAAAAPIFVATGSNDVFYETVTLPPFGVLIPQSEVFVAQARIGNRATNGDYEIGLHRYNAANRSTFPTSASPLGSASEIQFAWANGAPTAFTLTRTGTTVRFQMGGYDESFTDALVDDVDAISFRVAAGTGNTTQISALRFIAGGNTTNLRSFTASNGSRDLALFAEVTGDFTISGDLTFSWTGTPGGSNLSMQLKALEGFVAPVPEPAAAALFGLGLLGLAGVCRRRVAAT